MIPCGLESFGWTRTNRRPCCLVWGEPMHFEGSPATAGDTNRRLRSSDSSSSASGGRRPGQSRRAFHPSSTTGRSATAVRALVPSHSQPPAASAGSRSAEPGADPPARGSASRDRVRPRRAGSTPWHAQDRTPENQGCSSGDAVEAHAVGGNAAGTPNEVESLSLALPSESGPKSARHRRAVAREARSFWQTDSTVGPASCLEGSSVRFGETAE